MNSKPVEGKRRQLVRYLLHIQALKQIIQELEEHYGNVENKTRYNESFCDPNFVPTLGNEEIIAEMEYQHPLKSSISHSFYNQQVTDGILKCNASSLNLKEPFRKEEIISINVKNTLKQNVNTFK